MVSAIRNEGELRAAQGTLAFFEDMLRGMAATRSERGTNYRYEAGNVIYDILRIRRQIDDYIGLTDFAEAYELPSVEDDDRVRPRSAGVSAQAPATANGHPAPPADAAQAAG